MIFEKGCMLPCMRAEDSGRGRNYRNGRESTDSWSAFVRHQTPLTPPDKRMYTFELHVSRKAWFCLTRSSLEHILILPACEQSSYLPKWPGNREISDTLLLSTLCHLRHPKCSRGDANTSFWIQSFLDQDIISFCMQERHDRNGRESIDSCKPIILPSTLYHIEIFASICKLSEQQHLCIRFWSCFACEPRMQWPKWSGIQMSMKKKIRSVSWAFFRPQRRASLPSTHSRSEAVTMPWIRSSLKQFLILSCTRNSDERTEK